MRLTLADVAHHFFVGIGHLIGIGNGFVFPPPAKAACAHILQIASAIIPAIILDILVVSKKRAINANTNGELNFTNKKAPGKVPGFSMAGVLAERSSVAACSGARMAVAVVAQISAASGVIRLEPLHAIGDGVARWRRVVGPAVVGGRFIISRPTVRDGAADDGTSDDTGTDRAAITTSMRSGGCTHSPHADGCSRCDSKNGFFHSVLPHCHHRSRSRLIIAISRYGHNRGGRRRRVGSPLKQSASSFLPAVTAVAIVKVMMRQMHVRLASNADTRRRARFRDRPPVYVFTS